jgi:hypothetical protein
MVDEKAGLFQGSDELARSSDGKAPCITPHRLRAADGGPSVRVAEVEIGVPRGCSPPPAPHAGLRQMFPARPPLELTRTLDPGTHREHGHQEALRALIEAKLKGMPLKPRQVIAPHCFFRRRRATPSTIMPPRAPY